MYAVVNDDNTFSGVVYDKCSQDIINHHRQYEQKIVKIERNLTYDDEGNVNEVPTSKELANEITVSEDVAQFNYLLDLDFRLSLIELGV